MPSALLIPAALALLYRIDARTPARRETFWREPRYGASTAWIAGVSRGRSM